MQRGIRRHRRADVATNDRFIASARQHSLWIFAVGLFSAQLAWTESARQETYMVYSYLERVLRIVSVVQDRSSWQPSLDAGTSFSSMLELYEGPEGEMHATGDYVPVLIRHLAAMAGDNTLTNIWFPDGTPQIITRADPAGNCHFTVRQLGPSRADPPDKLVLVVKNESSAIHLRSEPEVALENTFFVEFGNCLLLSPPFMIAEYGADALGVSFVQEIDDSLDVQWKDDYDRSLSPQLQTQARDRVKRRFTSAQWVRLSAFDPPALGVLDVNMVKNLILEKAHEVNDEYYQMTELDSAIRVILTGVEQPQELWGLQLAPQSAALGLSALLVAISVSLLYRIRRIDREKGPINEPWIVIGPRGPVERVAAVMWPAALVGVAGVVMWTVIVYEGETWDNISGWLNNLAMSYNYYPDHISANLWMTVSRAVFGSGLFWGLALNAVAALLLLAVWRQLLHLGLDHDSWTERSGGGAPQDENVDGGAPRNAVERGRPSWRHFDS